MAKEGSHSFPAHRQDPLGAKVFSYYTQEERRLLEKAAKLERRSLSSFVALAALERAQRIIAGK